MAAGSGSTPAPEKDSASTSRSPDEPSQEPAPRVLVVEDSKADEFLIREALDTAGVRAELEVVHDGQAALRFLAEQTPPALVLLDLNLPKYNGREVLRRIREDARTKHLPVLVVTSSELPQEREALSALGFAGFFQKPSDYVAFLKLGPLVKGLLEAGRSK